MDEETAGAFEDMTLRIDLDMDYIANLLSRNAQFLHDLLHGLPKEQELL